MHLFITTGFLGLCLLVPTAAMGHPAEDANMSYSSSGSLIFFVNVCQFEGKTGKTLTEISYSLPLHQFVEESHDLAEKKAAFAITIFLSGSGRDTLVNLRETRNIPLPSEQNAVATDLFVDLKRFELEPDTVGMTITIDNLDTGSEGMVSQPLTIRKFQNEFSLSGLFFVTHIQKSGQKNVFDKNGILMLPNPSRIFLFSDRQKDAYVYYELYNMEFPTDRPSFYNMQLSVRDMGGKEVYSESRDAVRKSASTSSRIEIIPLQNISTGVYRCEIRITDLESEENRTASGYFRVKSTDSSDELMLPMTETDVQKYFDQIKYITTHQQQQTFKELDPAGKQRFLLDFWKSKDPTKGNSRNEFMEEHFRRIAYSEKNFRGGINSDMGRVYIQYGPPVEVTRQASIAATNKASEIWTYSINGTTEFDFVDRTGDGNYVLVNSTSPDEIHNPDWRQEIIRAVPESNRPYLNR